MTGILDDPIIAALCLTKRKDRSGHGQPHASHQTHTCSRVCSRLWVLFMVTLYTAIIATVTLKWGAPAQVPSGVSTTVARITLAENVDDVIVNTADLQPGAAIASPEEAGAFHPMGAATESKSGLMSLAQNLMGWGHEADTLVIYIYADTEPESRPNLDFFLATAVREGDRAHYIIVVQQASANTTLGDLPSLPSNAQYVLHANECYDWGTAGWLLSHGDIDRKRYKYFIVMNSSIRGPYLPAYLKGRIHWTEPFISKLNEKVKLVGSTISCEGVMHHGELRRNAHVQSYIVAIDQVGLELLIHDGNVLSCHNERSAAIYHAELGSSLAIYNAGYNVDSLQMRYQGVDWRDKSNWNCNGVESPLNEYMYDGTSLDPFEVVFIKMKRFMVDSGISYAVKADKYGKWSLGGEVNSNDYNNKAAELQFSQIVESIARGRKCFDSQYYKASNPDLKDSLADNDVARWRHFVFEGQFRYRPHRWLCPTQFTKLIDEMKKWPRLVLQHRAAQSSSPTTVDAKGSTAPSAAEVTAAGRPVSTVLGAPATAVAAPVVSTPATTAKSSRRSVLRAP